MRLVMNVLYRGLNVQTHYRFTETHFTCHHHHHHRIHFNGSSETLSEDVAHFAGQLSITAESISSS